MRPKGIPGEDRPLGPEQPMGKCEGAKFLGEAPPKDREDQENGFCSGGGGWGWFVA